MEIICNNCGAVIPKPDLKTARVPVTMDLKMTGLSCSMTKNSMEEARFDTIGDVTASTRNLAIGNPGNTVCPGKAESILFVVYTEQECRENGTVTRLISARGATSFERGLYYGNY